MSERQYGTLKEIRRDHVARYEFARDLLPEGLKILDAACGCGYGSYILSQKAANVHGVDASLEAIKYAQINYNKGNTLFTQERFPCHFRDADVAISFETIEHIKDDYEFLCELRLCAGRLICSVPNQEKLPFTKERFPFHFKHYTKEGFNSLLDRAGWRVVKWYGQEGTNSSVEPDINGRTLIADCE